MKRPFDLPCAVRRSPIPRLATALCLLASLAAQQGDRGAEDKTELSASTPRPDATVRGPTEAKSALRLQPGFEIDLVAHEPLVCDPVQAVFDSRGRMWVCEFRSYMRDVDATDELRADGRVVVLSDRDSDGRMDEVVPFLENVVLPRAVLPLEGGALVIAPPDVLWCVDADSDLQPERVEKVFSGLESGRANPEHCANGLLWGLDNRIHLAGDARMLRWNGEGAVPFVVEPTAAAGQWGIAQDDRGRLYYNYNEDWLRCDLVPRAYARRDGAAAMLPGMNHRLAPDPRPFPAQPTPGVNRGSRDGMLKDGMLQRHTAACAPLVYRGDAVDGCDGDAFVCEPAGNLVRRFRLVDHDGAMRAENRHESSEFLAAVDERFRPVNLTQGTDGAIYVVDMYRGVIQHKNFVTTFLRKQIKERSLEQPIGMGRIWRIRSSGGATANEAPLRDAKTSVLCAALSDRDGARRDMAQRILAQHGDLAAVPALRAIVRERKSPAALHAIAALDALSSLDGDDLRTALQSEEPGLLAFALRFSSPSLSRPDRAMFWACERIAAGAAPCVRQQLALTLGDVGGKGRDAAFSLLAKLGGAAGDDTMLAAHVAASAKGREPELARAILGGAHPAAGATLFALAKQAAASRDATLQQGLIDVAATAVDALAQERLLAGFCAAIPVEPSAARGAFRFAATPPSLVTMQQVGRPEIVAHVQRILGCIELVAEAAPTAEAGDDSLTDAQRARVASGARVYGTYCAACHQPQGQGLGGLAPPLAGSMWVTGEPERLIQVALHGVRGPLRAADVEFDGEMPPQGHIGDDDLAAALSFVRRAFGHRASCIDPEQVRAMRKLHAGRQSPWPAVDLQPK